MNTFESVLDTFFTFLPVLCWRDDTKKLHFAGPPMLICKTKDFDHVCASLSKHLQCKFDTFSRIWCTYFRATLDWKVHYRLKLARVKAWNYSVCIPRLIFCAENGRKTRGKRHCTVAKDQSKECFFWTYFRQFWIHLWPFLKTFVTFFKNILDLFGYILLISGHILDIFRYNFDLFEYILDLLDTFRTF